jgi:hypothetical protein
MILRDQAAAIGWAWRRSLSIARYFRRLLAMGETSCGYLWGWQFSAQERHSQSHGTRAGAVKTPWCMARSAVQWKWKWRDYKRMPPAKRATSGQEKPGRRTKR